MAPRKLFLLLSLLSLASIGGAFSLSQLQLRSKNSRRAVLHPPTRAATSPFPDLDVTSEEMQQMLCRDIERRYNDLVALAWLGRIYLLFDVIFNTFWPSVFRLDLYEDEPDRFRVTKEFTEATLRESSIIARGVPITMRFSTDNGQVKTPELLGIGCDLRDYLDNETGQKNNTNLSESEAYLAEQFIRVINEDRGLKRSVVHTIVSTIFQKLSGVPAGLKQRSQLQSLRAPEKFNPVREVFALEGTSEKWLQKVSGYYFAEAWLQEMRFDSSVVGNLSFTFYYDSKEPINSQDPYRNVNPEAICCNFLEYTPTSRTKRN